ncbi:MAG: GH3 auxin-responsive promoter family protein [Pirellulales bacterium]
MARSFLAQLIAEAVQIGPLADVRRMERRPDALQQKRLLTLLRQGADTEWGRAYGYRDLLLAADPVTAFQKRVPIRRYADLQPFIERTCRGEPDVIWPGRFRYFGVSGGTYSTGKLVPANEEMLSQTIRAGIAMTIRYLAMTGNLDAVTGAIIPLTGRLFGSQGQQGGIVGNFSGLLTLYHLQQLAAKSKAPPAWFPDTTESLFLEDWEQKLNRLADVTMETDVRYIALIPTWGLVFFRKLIERYNARFKASARCVRDIWPKLQLVVSGGVALAPYRELLAEIIGPPPIDLLETYGAMEAGLIAFQSSLDDRAMLLNSRGSFFEFIRDEDRDLADPERFWIGSVEPGQRYVPVISNSNGLWAYVLGDIVRFTQIRPPKLEVLGRTSEILTLYREGVNGEAARKALAVASRKCGATVVDFHVTYSSSPVAMVCHEWYVEFGTEPADMRRFAESLDEELGNACPSYLRVRRNRGLAPPRVLAIASGGLHRGLQRMGRQLDAQAKVPHLMEGRELAEALDSVVPSVTSAAAY